MADAKPTPAAPRAVAQPLVAHVPQGPRLQESPRRRKGSDAACPKAQDRRARSAEPSRDWVRAKQLACCLPLNGERLESPWVAGPLLVEAQQRVPRERLGCRRDRTLGPNRRPSVGPSCNGHEREPDGTRAPTPRAQFPCTGSVAGRIPQAKPSSTRSGCWRCPSATRQQGGRRPCATSPDARKHSLGSTSVNRGRFEPRPPSSGSALWETA